ncbi:MAG: AAC(3) family N-acetyltransferase [Calditrichae bacterium]|nr:AAC(3) family N-acetyltransferase [Calditrichia bacterium]
MTFKNWCVKTGIQPGIHLIVHSSFRAIRQAFNNPSPQEIIDDFKELLTGNGSLVMPAFTYCFRKKSGPFDSFDPYNSVSKVGALTEVFRHSQDVIRTASATHSFALWGNICTEIKSDNAPFSPLGKESVMQWLAEKEDSYILLLGVDFRSLSFGHYIENSIPLPWIEKNPWTYMDVESIGASKSGFQEISQVPGCSKSFINLEKYLLNNNIVQMRKYKNLQAFFIKTDLLLDHGKNYFSTFPLNALCPVGTCAACNTRHAWYAEQIKKELQS